MKFAFGCCLVFVVACGQVGCTSRKYVSRYETGRIEHAGKVIVKTSPEGSRGESSVHELEDVTVGSETLRGRDRSEKEIEIALADIHSVQIVEYSYSGLILAILAGGLVAGATGVMLALDEKVDNAPERPSSGGDGSCPYFYSFDGERFVFDAEPYAGSICKGLERTDWCALEHMAEADRTYRLRITNELPETQHIDEVKLVVVDHPVGTRVAPDLQGHIRTLARPQPPVEAVDETGRDLRDALSRRDGRFWVSAGRKGDPHRTRDRRDEITLVFPKPAGARRVKLVINGGITRWATQVAQVFLLARGESLDDWYREVDERGPAFFRLLAWYFQQELYVLPLEVDTVDGWQVRASVYGGGAFAPEDKVYLLDLEGVEGDVLRVRIAPPAHFWKLDYVAADCSDDLPVRTREIAALEARDANGSDLTNLLAGEDDDCFVMPHIGDRAELRFEAPPRTEGTVRSVLLKATGWYRLQLEGEGPPRTGLLEKMSTQPGFYLEYALGIRHKWEDALRRPDWEQRPRLPEEVLSTGENKTAP